MSFVIPHLTSLSGAVVRYEELYLMHRYFTTKVQMCLSW